MSWDSYIDNLIAQTKDSSGSTHADRACIIGLDGGAPWTTAEHAAALKVNRFFKQRWSSTGEVVTMQLKPLLC